MKPEVGVDFARSMSDDVKHLRKWAWKQRASVLSVLAGENMCCKRCHGPHHAELPHLF